jgi:hypothetical protein
MCDANLCPLLAAYDVAEAMIDKLGDLHDSPSLARGGIASNRQVHEAVRERYSCAGRIRDANGCWDCPLNTIRHIAHHLATVPNKRPGWAFDPDKLVDGGTDTQSGQYL